MFNFFKKKETKLKNEKFFIPEENRMEIYEIWDRYINEISGKQEKFALWAKLQEVLPDLDITDGDWSINASNILAPYIYRKKTK